MKSMFYKRLRDKKTFSCLLIAIITACLAFTGCTKPADDALAPTPPAIVFADDSYLRGQIDTCTFDVDQDGILEICSLDYGPTSGVFSFFFSVYEDETLEYRSLFTASHGKLSFTTLADGTTGIYLAPNREGAVPTTYAIRFVCGTLQLTANTEPGNAPTSDFPYTLAYTDGTDPETMQANALNRDKLAISSVTRQPIFRLDTAEELEQFTNTHLDTAANYSWDDAPSFRAATASYDETFFRDNSLLLIYISSGNRTHRYGLQRMDFTDNSLCIYLEETTASEIVCNLETAWILIIPVPDSMVAGCTDFDAKLGE